MVGFNVLQQGDYEKTGRLVQRLQVDFDMDDLADMELLAAILDVIRFNAHHGCKIEVLASGEHEAVAVFAARLRQAKPKTG